MKLKTLLKMIVISFVFVIGASSCNHNPKNQNVDYKVLHYKQNVSDDNYTLYETEIVSGIPGKETEAEAKEYTGFTAQTFEQKTVEEDGSTRVEIYYDRKIVTISFNTNGGTEIPSMTGKYGAFISETFSTTKEHYLLVSWSPALPNHFPDRDTTYEASWDLKGEVNNISLVIADIPSNTNQIAIYRKTFYEQDWASYLIIDKFGSSYPESLTIEDPFVEKNKTYNYKYLFINGINKIDDAVEFLNGETKNYTPLNGSGEISFKEKPKYTYSYGDSAFFLKEKAQVVPELNENTYDTFIYYETNNKEWHSTNFDFSTNQKIDLLYEFRYANLVGKKELKGFGPGYSIYEPETKLKYWYKGELENCSSSKYKATYTSDTLEVEEVPDGILVSIFKEADSQSWIGNEISIYEDDVRMKCYYNLTTDFTTSTERKCQSFVFPFVTEGKTYKFKLETEVNNIITKEIVSTKTSAINIDENKLNAAGTSFSFENVDNNTKLLKMGNYGKDVFTEDYTDLFRYSNLFTYFTTNTGNYYSFTIPAGEEQNLLNEGTNLLKLDNDNQFIYWSAKYIISLDDFYIHSSLFFSVEDYNGSYYKYGYLVIPYPESNTTWNWTATSSN